MDKQSTNNDKHKITEFYVNTHRKVIVNKVSESKTIVILDSLPHIFKKHLYEEVISLSEVNIVRRRIDPSAICRFEGYKYTITEEAVCLKNQEDCTVISYILNIECSKPSGCNDKEIKDLINCITSIY